MKKQTIARYVQQQARSKPSFEIWLTAVKNADWNTPEDIKKTFGSADLLGKRSERIVFNIGGNNYRIICKYVFGKNKVHLFVCWLGTHAAYDKICSRGEQYTINEY